MKNISDKPLILKMVIPGIIIMAGITLWFFGTFKDLASNFLFIAVSIIAAAGFFFFSYRAYAGSEDPNKDYNRIILVLFFALYCIWVGVWCAEQRAKEADGIAKIEIHEP